MQSLSPPDSWIVRDSNADSGLFSMQYIFNFCKPVAQPCKGEAVNVYEALTVMGQVTDTCEIIGRDRDMSASFIDERDKNKGFKFSYGSGDICQNSENAIENGQPRKVNFKVMCGDKQDENWKFTTINSMDVTKCNLLFTINSPAGCLAGASSDGTSATKILLYIIFVVVIYLACGVIYNQKVNSLQGMEAIPHKDFWKESPMVAKDGAHFLVEKIKQSVNQVRSKMGNDQNDNNQKYDSI
eukprot:TRINITY_DN2724_c0_g1_i1.p1 TRINITY_DN2724_c0_g1~~TRINITY_DN2724_c0_g1_i1.p1  ORF type:complete len:241 (-),score=37.45 TRINITY_DN2724_c0_g1_i1:164-886(-)